jgi:hypothetical protein
MLDLDEAGIRASAKRGRNRTKNTPGKDAPLFMSSRYKHQLQMCCVHGLFGHMTVSSERAHDTWVRRKEAPVR